MEEPKIDLLSYDIVTNALMDLINTFPALEEQVDFSVLGKEEGISLFPVSGGVIRNEVIDVTDHVTQECLYPFYVIYRAGGLSESRKAKVKEYLDNLGKWLEKQPVTIKDKTYQLGAYPTLTGDRQFKSITRTSPSYLMQTTQDMVDDWAISMQAIYSNEYDL